MLLGERQSGIKRRTKPCSAILNPLANGFEANSTVSPLQGGIVSHYQVLEKIGGGAMGVVYKAQDLRLGRFVALKFLPPIFIREEEVIRRFIQEARTASSLDHPNICTIFEIGGEDDVQMFIAMPYYKGETLQQKIKGGPMPADVAINFVSQTAKGLDKAHRESITHRDIKPANLFVTNDGIVKILDFGLAKLGSVEDSTKSGFIVGTAAYMSPEQVCAQKVDHRTDIWSLGVVMYELLSGRRPFQGEYEQVVMYSIVNEEPAPLTSAGALENIVRKALAKSMAERYQDIREMRADLEAVGAFMNSHSAKTAARPHLLSPDGRSTR